MHGTELKPHPHARDRAEATPTESAAVIQQERLELWREQNRCKREAEVVMLNTIG